VQLTFSDGNCSSSIYLLEFYLCFVYKLHAHMFVDHTVFMTRGGSSRRAAALSEKCKAKDSAKRGKFFLSLDLVTKFHNTIIFGSSDTIFAQSFLGIQQNQCIALFQRRRLCDDVFSTLDDGFGDFGAVFGTALKERNQIIGYKKHGGISAYRKAFLLF